MDQLYFFLPVEFVEWKLQSGDAGDMEAFDLPPVKADARDIHILPIPNISSLVFVFKQPEISYCTREQYDLSMTPQSLSLIIFSSLIQVFIESYHI
jgi:hypothetical protein